MIIANCSPRLFVDKANRFKRIILRRFLLFCLNVCNKQKRLTSNFAYLVRKFVCITSPRCKSLRGTLILYHFPHSYLVGEFSMIKRNFVLSVPKRRCLYEPQWPG